jgi:hypothetical protein
LLHGDGFPEVYPGAAAPAIEFEHCEAIMRLRWFFRTAALAVVFASGCQATGCGKARKASSPEDAVHLLEMATRDGNFEQRLALTPKKNRDMVVKVRDTLKHLKQAADAFNDALDARFGPEPAQKRMETRDLAATFDTNDDNARIEIISQQPKDENAVQLKLKMTRTSNEKTGTTKSTDVDCVAVKEDDGWKLVMGTDEHAESKDDLLVAALERQINFYEQGTDEVKAGKYPSRIEAVKTFQSRFAAKH